MAYSSVDVPAVFDVWINGNGYRVDQSYDDSPFRKAPAEYGYTPTFVERQNVGGDYGDSQQDFFLTEAQRDWSLGESRAHFDPSTPEGSRMFYASSGIDPTVEGQITLAGGVSSQSLGSNFVAGVSGLRGWYTTANSHLNSFFVGDLGAHGLGTATMTVYGMCEDSNAVFMATTSASTVGVRRYDIAGASFSTFSATASDSIAFLNNTLYGAVNSTGVLQSYSTAGVATTIFTWKDSAGNARKQTFARLLAFGGSLLILIQPTNDRAELWQYNNGSTFMIARLPQNFEAYEMAEVDGVVFLSGSYHTSDYTTAISYVPAIFTYLNGNLDELWRPPGPIDIVGNAAAFLQEPPALAGWHNTLLFTSQTDLMRYDLSSGAIYSLGAVTVGNMTQIVTWEYFAEVLVPGTTSRKEYQPGRAATTGTVTSAQFDFNSSLVKYMRGIRIFWSGAAGTSVDIGYALDGATSFTSLQVGAVSGTEYAIAASARTISVQLTLHGSGSANYNAPLVTRLYVRAAPILPSYRNNIYILDCSGNKAAPQPGYLILGNGFVHDKDGLEMVADLQTAIAAGIIPITDRFGTFNGIIEPGATQFKEVKSGYGRAEYRVELAVRDV